MIILCVKFQSEKLVIFISICSLIMRTDLREKSCISNNETENEIVFYCYLMFLQ